MNPSVDPTWTMSAATRRKVDLARLEADIAYFHARLELLGHPSTSNQTAQRKAFRYLYKYLSTQAAAEREVHAKAFSVEGLFDG